MAQVGWGEDVTLKEHLYTLTLALFWTAMSHLQHRAQEEMLWFHSFTGISYARLCGRWIDGSRLVTCSPLCDKLRNCRRRPKTAPFVSFCHPLLSCHSSSLVNYMPGPASLCYGLRCA